MLTDWGLTSPSSGSESHLLPVCSQGRVGEGSRVSPTGHPSPAEFPKYQRLPPRICEHSAHSIDTSNSGGGCGQWQSKKHSVLSLEQKANTKTFYLVAL